MADLTLKDLTAPVDDLMQFIPPASSAYKSYLFPGFYSAGQTPSITPNPVMGDNAVAAPAAGEPSYVAPPEAPIQGPTMLSSLRSIDPRGPGTSVDERAATRAADVKSAGEVTDPMDAAKAVMNGLGFLSGTGVATNAITAAASAAGINPLDDVFGNSWDLKSNTNLRPGYSEAYDAAIRSGASPQAALNHAQNTIQDNASVPARFRAAAQGKPTATPTPTPVTQANSVTGFQRPGAPAAPTGSGALASTTTDPSVTAGYAPAAPSVPAAPVAPVGRPSGYGTPGAGGINPNNSYSGAMSAGNHNDLTNRDRGAGGGGPSSGGGGGAMGSNAGRRGFAEGGVITPPTAGNEMFRAATQSTAPADAGQPADPYQDDRYNPDPSMTDPQGVVDGVPAALTPGEFVVMRDAAQQYDPQVLAALNDPAQAASINELIESLLNGGEDPAGMNESDDGSDDGHGIGIAGRSSSPIDPSATMNATPRGGSMLRNLSRLG